MEKSNQENSINKEEEINTESKVEKTEEGEEIVEFQTPEIKEEEPKQDKELESLKDALSESQNNYLRLRADYENFRRRNQEATIAARTDGMILAVESILPVIDSVDRAMAICVDDKSKEGLALIKKQISASLSQLGVQEIPTEGESFDPKLHNAVQRVEVEDASEVGKVLEVYQRGYEIHGKVIRYSMVKVGVEKE